MQVNSNMAFRSQDVDRFIGRFIDPRAVAKDLQVWFAGKFIRVIRVMRGPSDSKNRVNKQSTERTKKQCI